MSEDSGRMATLYPTYWTAAPSFAVLEVKNG